MSVSAMARKAHVDEFSSRLRSICGEFAVRPASGDKMITGGVSLERRGNLEIAEIESNSEYIVRDGRCIRRDPGEYFFLIVQKSGQATMQQGNSHFTLERGSAILIDSVLPSEFRYGGQPSHQISVHLSRTEFFQRFGPIAPAGLMLKRETPIATAMHVVLQELLLESRAEKLTFLGEALLNILGARIAEEVRYANNIEYQMAHRARQLIAACFRDPELSPSSIADQLGISLRRLQRLFEGTGEKVSQLIKSKRLDYACCQLIARAQGARHDFISRIAYEAGFNDLSYFNKSFLQTYGTTPNQIMLSRKIALVPEEPASQNRTAPLQNLETAVKGPESEKFTWRSC